MRQGGIRGRLGLGGSAGSAGSTAGSAGSVTAAGSIAPDAWAAGSSIVKVDPRPGSDQTDTLPPWLSATCLTIARPEPGAAGRARARRVDAVEALEDALLLVGRDAEPLVGDGDVDDAGAAAAHHDADAGAAVGVGDGVADEVADGGRHELGVAPHLAALVDRRDELDAVLVGDEPAAVGGVAGARADVDEGAGP